MSAQRLIIHLAQIAADGLALVGELSPDVFEPTDDRLQCHWPLRYRLHASLVDGRLAVLGSLQARFRLRCDRCLAHWEQDFTDDQVTHLYEDLDSDEVDLTDDLREDALLLLPDRFLCDEDPDNCADQQLLRRFRSSPERLGEDPAGGASPWGKLDDLQL